jgi:hypothetical protein
LLSVGAIFHGYFLLSVGAIFHGYYLLSVGAIFHGYYLLSVGAIFHGYYLHQQEKSANYTLMCTIHDKLWSFFVEITMKYCSNTQQVITMKYCSNTQFLFNGWVYDNNNNVFVT